MQALELGATAIILYQIARERQQGEGEDDWKNEKTKTTTTTPPQHKKSKINFQILGRVV